MGIGSSTGGARWLPGAHAMTIFGPLLRRGPRVPTVRERWELADGDFIDVDRLAPAGDTAPLLLVLHGLEGSSSAHYVRGALAQARARGWGGLALNFRGCSGEPNRLLRSYHSGETADLDVAVARVREERPGANIVLLGFSLGGNVLVKWLGEQGARIRGYVAAAAAVSVPFDLALCAGALDGPGAMAWVYRTRFLRTLRRKATGKGARFAGRFDVARAARVRSLREFDDVVTSQLHGFADADDYFRQSSSGPFVPRVRVPLYLLSALDDPFIPASCLPRAAAAANPCVQLEIVGHGGHLGFVEGPPWRPRFIAETRAVEFLSAQLPRARL